MRIASFISFELAKNEAIKYAAGAKRHPGLKGVRYSVHHLYGQYAIVRTRDFIPSIYGDPIYIVRV